jgi:hypothetical protein
MFFEDSSAVEALPHNFKIVWENTLDVSHYLSSLSITHFTLISSPLQQGTNNPAV